MGGDIEGYVWGKTNQRVEVPVVNEREKQTYFGALDLVEGKVVIQAHEKGNTECQIAF
jgi:putative transposase